MTAPIDTCLDRWHRHIAGQLDGGFDALLHPDVVFHSPILFAAQHGRDLTTMYLTAAFEVLLAGADEPGFRYTKQVASGTHAVLEFETTIDGTWVNGVDVLTCDDEGLVTEMRVMVRPLRAVHLLQEQMLAMLEQLAP